MALGCGVKIGGGTPIGAILAVDIAIGAMEGAEELHGGCRVCSDL